MAAAAAFDLAWQGLNTGLVNPGGLMHWFWVMLAAAVGIAFLAMVSAVDLNKWLFWGVNFAILLAYILIPPPDPFVYAGGGLFFLFVWLFERSVREDEHSRVDFSASRILRHGIDLMVYGLLLVAGFNIYAHLAADFRDHPQEIYNRIGYYAAAGLDYVPSGIGNFDPNQSFDEFAAEQASREDPDFAQALPSVQQQLTDQLKQQLTDRFHLQIQGNPLLGEVVAGAVADKVEAASQAYSQFFPAIFTVIIVILLRSAAFLFVWLASIVSWILFRLLLALRFFRISKVQVEVDKLSI